ncbi:hypothetical protein MYX65_05775 [Acidobacteria bacterium AH-259-L09]|nr:hypothetical protein [Acidobacteria bacterium AH-259-L09]
MDLHCETIEMSVVREGEEIFKLKVPTEEHHLREAIASLIGPEKARELRSLTPLTPNQRNPHYSQILYCSDQIIRRCSRVALRNAG